MKKSTKIEFTCEHCDESFERYPSQVRNAQAAGCPPRFCTNKCRNAAVKAKTVKIELTCEHCGKPFWKYSSEVMHAEAKGYKVRFCNSACQKADQSKSKIALTCERCGLVFWRYRAEVARHTAAGRPARFCTAACRAAHVAESRSQKIVVICTCCGLEFERRPSHLKSANQFCSKKCHVRFGQLPVKCEAWGKRFMRAKAHVERGSACYCSRKCQSAESVAQLICATCGISFRRRQSQVEGRINHYCSNKCRGAAVTSWATGSGLFGVREDIGHAVRSRWEANFARILIALGIEYEYEPTCFDLGDTTYLPDFKIGDEYYEIKGYMRPNAKRKIEAFRTLYPEIPLHLIDQHRYKQLAAEWKSRIPQWEGR